MTRPATRAPSRAIAIKSPDFRAGKIAHAKALASPMTRIPMVSDPHLERADQLADDRLRLERRACQYAAWIAERDGLASLPLRNYNASYDGEGLITFACYGGASGAHEFTITIPAHILAFDASAPALAIAAPAEHEPTPHCDATIALALDAPGEATEAPRQKPALIASPAPAKAPTRRASKPEPRVAVMMIRGVRVKLTPYPP